MYLDLDREAEKDVLIFPVTVIITNTKKEHQENQSKALAWPLCPQTAVQTYLSKALIPRGLSFKAPGKMDWRMLTRQKRQSSTKGLKITKPNSHNF